MPTSLKPSVSVIVPTYKRAHLLEQTLPSYLQPQVLELIVIDDCSPDNTQEVLARMAAADPRIRVFRQPQNMGQVMAKNRAKTLARGSHIYMGDDDSVLLPGSIAALMQTAARHPASLIGASAVYMHHHETSPAAAAARRTVVHKATDVVALDQLRFRFDSVCDHVLPVAVCHACFLIETRQAALLDFDDHYKGNRYREETDFLLRYRALGHHIFFDSRAVQVNLPAAMATGGSRKSFWKTEYFIMANTLLMLKRNRAVIRRLSPGFSAPLAMAALLAQRIEGVIRRNRARGIKLLKKLNTSAA